MPSSRRAGLQRCAWAAAATAAVIAAACSGSPSPTSPTGDAGATDGTTGGDPDAGMPPGFDAPPPTGLFPLRVAGDGSSLISADGKPFLLHGEAAWSLIAEPTSTGAMQYLADRHTRGVTALLVNLIEHMYSDHPPKDAAGDAPFTKAGDFATPNEAYFAHADQIIDLAASQGMAVLLFPAYLGFDGGSQGWYQEMSTMPLASCTSYGQFLGQRYANRQNIVWMWGGDYTPPSGLRGEMCMLAIRDGIIAAEPGALASAHWSQESTSYDEPAFTGAIDLIGVYTYQPDLQPCLAARTSTAHPRMPTFLMETCYEGETLSGCMAAPSEARRRQFWGWLGCGAGEFTGNHEIWQFTTGWQQQLGSPASVSASRLVTMADQLAWQTLEVDDALLEAGGGTSGHTDEVAAARTADRSRAVIYVPPDGASKITVNLGELSGAVTATWEDPTADHAVPAGTGLSGSVDFTIPGSNMAGDQDWVLLLSAP
jgi:hypothetical protein